MWHDGGGLGAGGWIVMSLMMLVFWAVVVGGRGQTGASRAGAQQILDERFARGELTEEEYRQRRALLTSR
jgi:putative membrane protein